MACQSISKWPFIHLTCTYDDDPATRSLRIAVITTESANSFPAARLLIWSIKMHNQLNKSLQLREIRIRKTHEAGWFSQATDLIIDSFKFKKDLFLSI